MLPAIYFIRSAFIYGTCLFLSISSKCQNITTFAGNGIKGYNGDGIPATNAQLSGPYGITFDKSGNLYIAEQDGSRIRKVDALTHQITTIAGTGIPGFSGDGGPATAAQLNGPIKVAIDSIGNVYILDYVFQVVRKINAANGIISTVAGTFNQQGYSGDGGPATSAIFFAPLDLIADKAGNIYIADFLNNRVRKVNAADGIINTIAGNGLSGYSGDGGLATNARLNNPISLALDTAGNLYIADFNNFRIRKVNATDGKISTVAGTGVQGIGGDGGSAAQAQFDQIVGLTIDGYNNIYTIDDFHDVVRKINASDGIINTIAGNGTPGFSGDGGSPLLAQLDTPQVATISPEGNLYIADLKNNRIREIIVSSSLALTDNFFSVTLSGSSAMLEWNNSESQPYLFFDVQHSNDGLSWSTIGRVSRYENGNDQVYHFVDTDPIYGVNYYRLLKMEADFHFEYSEVKIVRRKKNAVLFVYPNPFKDNGLYVEVKSQPVSLTYRIIDVTGKTLQVGKIAAGVQYLNLRNLSQGLYIMVLSDGQNIKLEKQ